MGCGGSKDAVATGNTTAANGAGRGKLFRRKSTMSASHRSSQASSSSSDGTSVAIKDVVKEPEAGETKAADAEVARDEKPVSVAVKEKKEQVVQKDVTDDVVAAAVVAEAAAVVTETAQPPVKKEDELPKSTMAVEVPVVDEAKPKEAVVAEETKEKGTSPASTNEGDDIAGKSVAQSTTKPMEAKPVDDHKAEVAAPVPESSSQEKTTAADGLTPTESPAN